MEVRYMNLVLVDEKDNEIGTDEKLKAHKEGKLHRAFSIFIFNSKGEMLLQKRAGKKYHSGGLWTNACCSHPEPNKIIGDEAERRLKEEMGIGCKIKEILSFIYKADLGDLMEYEFDHVFVGKSDDNPKLDPEEAEDWKWISPEDLQKDVKENPEKYTHWFKIIFNKVLNSVK